jgi:hypothetical protein
VKLKVIHPTEGKSVDRNYRRIDLRLIPLKESFESAGISKRDETLILLLKR